MKNKIIICILVLVVFIIGLIIIEKNFLNQKSNDDNLITEAQKFKEEYEKLNGKTNEKNNKEYKSLNIPKDNPIKYANYDKVFEILDGTGIIYFGFPECPWCRNAVPVILKTAKELEIDEIYYLNNLEDRDIKNLVNGKIVTEKEANSNYIKLLEKLGTEFTSEYSGLEDSAIRRIYFPTVLIVKDGKVLKSIVGTVDSQENPYIPLTTEQTNELKNNYKEHFQKLVDACSVDTSC